jgi:hypothetical protein
MDQRELIKKLIAIISDIPKVHKDPDGYSEAIEIIAKALPIAMTQVIMANPQAAKTLWMGATNYQEEEFSSYLSKFGG